METSILGLYRVQGLGIMEKKMEITIMGYLRITEYMLGFYWDLWEMRHQGLLSTPYLDSRF